jgi:hypothetical protein
MPRHHAELPTDGEVSRRPWLSFHRVVSAGSGVRIPHFPSSLLCPGPTVTIVPSPSPFAGFPERRIPTIRAIAPVGEVEKNRAGNRKFQKSDHAVMTSKQDGYIISISTFA